ncbi:di-trans,poly-cis-decaprenylcistransferase [Patescibacteria group bacterium]|nr:di-trans,poly-cis-decaprenylcistransferase [Patescibacteria group bacterium]
MLQMINKKTTPKNLPRHVAFIPDGNRRWATRRGLAPWKGHREGKKIFYSIVQETFNAGIPYVTFWAASEENLLKRNPIEIKFLVKIICEVLRDISLKELRDKKIRLRVLGRWQEILHDARIDKRIRELETKTAASNQKHLTILLGYSGKQEIMQAIRKLQSDAQPASKESVKAALWTKDLPPLDLIIRTGETDPKWCHWSSGFMMWDAADAEMYFTETFWPDFSKEELHSVINGFSKRRRKLGS